MKLAWGARVSPAFCQRVVEIAAEIGCDASDLMACIAFETGETFDPAKKSPVSTATGLIQFLEPTARGLGTTTAELARMTAEGQLELVRRYFLPYKGRVGTLRDLYMAIFWPKEIGQPAGTALFPAGTLEYEANAALDVGKKGFITNDDCASFVQKKLEKGLLPANVRELEAEAEEAEKGGFAMPILSLIAAFGPMIVSMIPQVARLFDKTAETPAKVDAVTKLFDTVVTATGTPNVQAAVEAMQSDPKMLEKAKAAVVTEPTIMGLLEIGGGIEAARKANLEMQTAARGFWHNPAFWVTCLLSLFPIALVVDVFYVHPASYAGELRTQIVTSLLGVILVISGYWLGTSAGSVRKTDIMAQQSQK